MSNLAEIEIKLYHKHANRPWLEKIYKRGNRHSNSVLKELRKLTDRPRAKGVNVCVIKIPQNLTHFLQS